MTLQLPNGSPPHPAGIVQIFTTIYPHDSIPKMLHIRRFVRGGGGLPPHARRKIKSQYHHNVGPDGGPTNHEETSVITWINVHCQREARGNWSPFVKSAYEDWNKSACGTGLEEKKMLPYWKRTRVGKWDGYGSNPIGLGNQGWDRIIQDEVKSVTLAFSFVIGCDGEEREIHVSQILSALKFVTHLLIITSICQVAFYLTLGAYDQIELDNVR